MGSIMGIILGAAVLAGVSLGVGVVLGRFILCGRIATVISSDEIDPRMVQFVQRLTGTVPLANPRADALGASSVPWRTPRLKRSGKTTPANREPDKNGVVPIAGRDRDL